MDTIVPKLRVENLLFSFCDEPERDGHRHAVKQRRRQRHDTFDQIVLNDLFADLAFSVSL